MNAIEDGKLITKAGEVPTEAHWAFLEFSYPNREDGYGGSRPELDLGYYAFTSEEALSLFVLQHLARNPNRAYAVLKVEGRLFVQQKVSLSFAKH